MNWENKLAVRGTLLHGSGSNRDPEPGFVQGEKWCMAGTLGLQIQWGMPTNFANGEFGPNRKRLNPKY